MFRRSKDLIDIYALAHCVRLLTTEIFEVIESKCLELGGFIEFLTRSADVEHAYNKLQGVEGKPLFDEVYLYLKEFIFPFAQKDKMPRIWNSGKRVWVD